MPQALAPRQPDGMNSRRTVRTLRAHRRAFVVIAVSWFHGSAPAHVCEIMPLTSSIDDIAASLSRFVGRRLSDRALREDMVQETLARLLAYSRLHEVKDAAALARRIAMNLITDHFRDRIRHPTDNLSEEVPTSAANAEEIVMHRERVRAFGQALETMPPLRREVFTRLRLHGETPREISAALNLSEAAVEKHLTRALEQLHREVGRAERPRPASRSASAVEGGAR